MTTQQTTTGNATPALSPDGRIYSIDQFRGYTVLGMFVVNYLGHYRCHYNFHHNDYFLSYADTIMPSFMFAVGISFRLTILKRLAGGAYLKTYWSYLKRCIALCLISMAMYGIGQDFDSYQEFFTDPTSDEIAQAEWDQFIAGDAEATIPPHFSDQWWLLAKLIAKSYLWETLAVIGITQLFVLPFANLRFWYRFVVLIVLGAAHVALSEWFNWQFFYGYTIDGSYVDLPSGLNNWMGEIWGTGSNRSWDGGICGILTWSVAMLAGTLCYDLMAGNTSSQTIKNLLRWGVLFLIAGYAMSCLSCLYDLPADPDSTTQYVPAAADKRITNSRGKAKGGMRAQLAASPVIPDWRAVQGRSFTSFFAEPPFVARPENRLVNYWMMQKRFASLPYVVFVSGLAFVLLALFVVITDIGGIQIGVFRTFGMNPLAAYVLHKLVLMNVVFHVVPKNSAAWLYWSGLFVYLAVVYLLVRGLEKQGVYIRL